MWIDCMVAALLEYDRQRAERQAALPKPPFFSTTTLMSCLLSGMLSGLAALLLSFFVICLNVLLPLLGTVRWTARNILPLVFLGAVEFSILLIAAFLVVSAKEVFAERDRSFLVNYLTLIVSLIALLISFSSFYR